MLRRLHIKNYALIEEIDLIFSPGFNVITGETGTGKSIMLKGLSLILGKRAEKEAVRNNNEKIIVEGHFQIKEEDFKNLFESLDLDFDPHTIIRREITPSGKSRAFVNDTPVLLDTLEMLGNKLIDIHSQHQQLLLQKKSFRFDFIDSMAENGALRETYRKTLLKYRQAKEKLQQLQLEKKQLEASADYRNFQLREMETLDWELDYDEVEQRLKNFQNQEEIILKLNEAIQLLEDENAGIMERFRQLQNLLTSLASYDRNLEQLHERTVNLMPELQELNFDLQNIAETYRWMDLGEKEKWEAALNHYYALLQKHKVNSKTELKALYDRWIAESNDSSLLDERIANLETEIRTLREELEKSADNLHERRKKILPETEKIMQSLLAGLGMENSWIRIRLIPKNEFDEFGKADLDILLSPDKGKTFGDIRKIASGGEMSRIMLVIKYLISQKKRLPTIVFDEIDTGVSGEVARQTAHLLSEMSRKMQIISITHLPQMAVQGDKHFKVFKNEIKGKVVSEVKELTNEERIREIAEMIEGKPPSPSALEHAAHLLKKTIKS